MRKLYSSVILSIVLCFGFINETKATTYFFVGTSGSQITDLHAWNTNSTAAVTSSLTAQNPTSFTVATSIWNFYTSTPLSLAATWSVSSNATVTIGDGTNSANFTVASGGVIGTSTNVTTPKITVSNACTLTINTGISNWNVSATKTIFSTGSMVIYGPGSSPQTFGCPYYDLMINTGSVLNGSAYIISHNLTTNSTLNLAFSPVNVAANVILNANILLGGGTLTVGGQLQGSAAFDGNASGGVLILNGTGNIGTINMVSPFGLSGLVVNLGNSTSSVTLGTDLIADGGTSSLSSGVLNLNGHILTFDNNSTTTNLSLGGATILGSSSSALSISTASLSGSLTMATGGNTLNSLYLNSSGQTLTLGNSLSIADSISSAAGTIASGSNLTILSTSALHGRVGMMGASGSISGNVSVQIFAPGGATGWANLGAGGVNGETIGSWDGQFPITCVGCAYTPGDANGFYSIQGYDETDPNLYETNITSATPLTPGEGFWVYLGTGSSTTSDIIINNTGSIVQGQVNRTITNSNITGVPAIDGYNLVSNPYASPISLDALYSFNSQGNNWYSAGIYIWNADSDAGETPGVGFNFIIPAGQGFFVQCDVFSSPATLTFDESMKTADNTVSNSLMRTTSTQSVASGFKLNVKGSNGDADKTLFRFNSGATVNYDKHYDMHKMFNTPGYAGTGPVYSQYTSISSVYQNDKYALNTLPVLTGSISIPVLIRVSATGTYSISISDVNDYNSCTILKDNLTGQYHDLSTGAYVCTISDTTSAPRFEMVLCEASSPTGIKQLIASSGSIQVMQDNDGPFVVTHFPQSTKASISVFNVVGQQLINNLIVEGKDTSTRLNVNSHNEVLLIKVTTDTETVTKKVITH